MPRPGRKHGTSPKDKPGGRRALVEKALALLERRIDDDRMSSSLADLVRLLELAREWEVGGEQVVVVRWVDPDEVGEQCQS